MGFIQTVCGPIAPQALGRTLIHEHIMVDFIGADRTGPHRWDPDEVVQTMRSYSMSSPNAVFGALWTVRLITSGEIRLY